MLIIMIFGVVKTIYYHHLPQPEKLVNDTSFALFFLHDRHDLPARQNDNYFQKRARFLKMIISKPGRLDIVKPAVIESAQILFFRVGSRHVFLTERILVIGAVAHEQLIGRV